MVDTLQQEDILENTVIIYTSDHGFHLGEFTMPIDKETFNNQALAVLLSVCCCWRYLTAPQRQPYEFDIRVPLLMRGPGIPANSSSAVPATMVDLAPTLLALAGLHNTTASLDGVDLLGSAAPPHRRFLVEYRWAGMAVWCSAKLVLVQWGGRGGGGPGLQSLEHRRVLLVQSRAGLQVPGEDRGRTGDCMS